MKSSNSCQKKGNLSDPPKKREDSKKNSHIGHVSPTHPSPCHVLSRSSMSLISAPNATSRFTHSATYVGLTRKR